MREDRDEATWPAAALICLLGAAVAQIVAAVLFFFAANWWTIGGLTKIAVIDGFLAAAAVAAAVSSSGGFPRAGAAMAGAMLSGILFAVHGQIWQTGADAWELFALWTAMAAVWAVASGATGVWAAMTALAVTTLTSAADQLGWSMAFETGLLSSAAAVAAIWGLRFALRKRWPEQAPGNWFNALAIAAFFVLTTVAGWGNVLDHGARSPLFWATLATAAGAAAMFRATRSSYAGYSSAFVSAIVLVATLVLQALLEGIHDAFAAAIVLLMVGAASLEGSRRLLMHLLAARSRFDAAPASFDLAAGRHIAIEIGMALLGWFGAAIAGFGIGLMSIWLFDSKGDSLLGLIGFVAAVHAAVAFFAARRSIRIASRFARYIAGPFTAAAFCMGTVFLLMAYAKLVEGKLGEWDFNPSNEAMLAATIGATVLLPAALASARTADASFVVAAFASVLWGYQFDRLDPWGMTAWIPVFTAVALALFERSDDRPPLRGAALALFGAAFFAPGVLDCFHHQPMVGDLAARGAATVTAAAMIGWSLRRYGTMPEPRVGAALAAGLAACLVLPGAAAGTFGLFAVAMGRRSPLLAGFALACGGWSIVRLYYWLELPLDQKAGLMAIGGLVCLGVWGFLARPRIAACAPVKAAALAAFLACAVLPAGIEGWGYWSMHAIATSGTRVLLALRPADPRSLVQGDYMAFRYDPALLRSVTERCGNWPKQVLLTLDDKGIARSARADDGSAHENEVPVRLWGRCAAPQLAADSFLFPEGTVKVWAEARFVDVRVLKGKTVIVGLADKDGGILSPLQPKP